ncbi:DUF1361 domain-containing protein [Hyunsoonleella pacifica]|uniref:DUF1361 domain-containing protein n=1 Tax=Hyunsoonleella pacifica TaxID=1080224 RepID=A0A4Q9FLF5_9FLAO|nr:DUF1361 domain-containing protein [Hyunsoonleella pacifica]TBN13909.1 DUF1361 domain-containing protein [Hyunsoonleella pacifica]GGD26719.1 membrane protein [Hyunsoonleella pacifica]
MDNIKHLLFKQFKIVAMLTVAMLFSIIILMIRMKLTHSFFYLFLVWNLFLAVIPYAITTYLVSLPKLNKLWLGFWFGVWLLFLPNAPYLVTDLIHLRLSTPKLIWLDILTVLSFALSGLLLFYFSFIEMKEILKLHVKKQILSFFTPFIVFLSAFGVYLGRFLRYNSWEVIQNPLDLFEDIFQILLYPSQNLELWLFILVFGAFLNLGFWMFNNIKSSN